MEVKAHKLSILFQISLLILSVAAQVVFSGGKLVEYLPGYHGKLPFKLETGYISVGDSELFYYFLESQGNPKEDPIFLWLTGGPGCSSLNGVVYEIGPIEFDIDAYEGGLPNFKYYPYSWTKTASILFLDSPVGSGFSYSRTQQGWPSSDTKAAQQAYEFFVKWLNEHPQYLALQLYVAGDSYSGIIVPLITQMIVQDNLAGRVPKLNLKGYHVGSPWTDKFIDENSRIPFSHRMALISDGIYEAAELYCNGNYIDVDSNNTGCLTALDDYNQCIKDLYTNAFLEPKCAYASPRPHPETWRSQRALQEAEFILSPPKVSNLWCRAFNYVLSDIWANDETVQEALHVRKGTVDNWKRCNESLVYTYDQTSVIEVHRNLSTQNLNVIVYNGDRDILVPFIATQQCIKLLNLTVDDPWRPWFVDGQVAGYTTKYTENGYRLIYATVKGAGHTAPTYYRRRCYEMFNRWVHWYPL